MVIKVPEVPEGRPHPRGGAPRRARRLYDNYGLVLIWTLVTLLIIGGLGEFRAGRVLGPILLGGIFVLTLRVSSVGNRRYLIAVALTVVALVAAIVAAVAGASTAARIVTVLISVAFVIASPVVIVRRIVRHPEVSLRTVLGALCVYVFLGLLFALVYAAYGVLDRDPFFEQVADPTTLDYVYFSLVTLTTVGFGDLSPVSDLGRMTAVIEAILGQLYLVTVIALLVSNLGRKRGSGDDVAEPDEHEYGGDGGREEGSSRPERGRRRERERPV